jgi:hypothetical protein
MTKLRPPCSPELALTRIAGVIGWRRVAEIARHGERAVRKWSDPDCQPNAADKITLEIAHRLDLAYRAAGGEGAPMLQCYALRLETEMAELPGAELAQSVAVTAKEAGDAIAAGILASRPGATVADLAVAEREIEEMVSAGTNTLATLRAGRKGGVSTPGGAS